MKLWRKEAELVNENESKRQGVRVGHMGRAWKNYTNVNLKKQGAPKLTADLISKFIRENKESLMGTSAFLGFKNAN
jgi:hypothetical protein